MAINNLFMDGFDQYAKHITGRPANLMRYAGYTVSGSPTLADGRLEFDPGGKSILLRGNSVQRSYQWQTDTLSFGVAVKFALRGGLYSLTFGSNPPVVIWTDRGTGLVNCGGSHGYVMPIPRRWYYFECLVDRDSGLLQVFVNGKADVTVTLPFSLAGVVDVTVRLNVYDHPPNSIDPSDQVDSSTDRWFDDLYLNSGDRLTPVQVTTRFPSEATLSQWNSTEEGVPNWQLVSGTVDELNKYLYANTDGQTERYISSKSVFDSQVVAIGTLALVRKATPDPVKLELFVDSSSVETSDVPLMYQYKFTYMDGSLYTKGSVEASEFGVRIEV